MKIARFVWREEVRWGIVEDETVYALTGSPWDEFGKGEELCPLGEVRLLAPAEPGVMIACGLNYMASIVELGRPIPKEPSLFVKPANTVVGPEADIIYPSVSRDLRCESELCCVIGRQAANVPEEEALDHVLGYTCGNDCTLMDLIDKDGHLVRAKGFDTAGPLGPWLVTGLDPDNVAIKGRLNGETKQDGSTAEMIFKVRTLVSYISGFMTLRPGDVIWTGTPKGGHYGVNVGDTVEVEIEGIGVLRNRVGQPRTA